MAIHIQTEILEQGGAVKRALVLPGAVEGLACRWSSLEGGDSMLARADGALSRVFVFVGGSGHACCGGQSFAVDEIALLACGHQHAVEIVARERLAFIELEISMSAEDIAWTSERPRQVPFFTSYSTCRTYREAIKSDRTVNRTLLPVDIAPRFCAGSVQTVGPDLVAPHRHPMLEQVFLGLEGNDCVFRADGAEVAFTEGMLLHVPLGSEHSVSVRAGSRLHYLWLDLFRDYDLAQITKNHIED
jgi:mannose-6-phosphate isomerase-like protein (cupin superfamily)